MSSIFRNIQKHVMKNLREHNASRAAAARGKKLQEKSTRPPSPRRSRLEQAQRLLGRQPGSAHRLRELICAEHDVPNTGRQWKKLRKRLAREDRRAPLAAP